MSEQQLTYEIVLALIRENSRETREEHREFQRSLKEQGAEFDRRMQEADRRMQEAGRKMQERDAEYARRAKATNRKIGELTGSLGRVIERMVSGHNIIKQFQDLGYVISSYSRNKTFGHDLSKGNQGEIDLFLENGDVAILVEVKTTLKAKNVGSLMDKLERFRRDADAKGDKRRFIGAVAGAVVEGDAKEVAHENGMYVIVQSGKAMEILKVPEGFKAREW